jgi:hypothetical protein
MLQKDVVFVRIIPAFRAQGGDPPKWRLFIHLISKLAFLCLEQFGLHLQAGVGYVPNSGYSFIHFLCSLLNIVDALNWLSRTNAPNN